MAQREQPDRLIGYVTWNGGLACAELWARQGWRTTLRGVEVLSMAEQIADLYGGEFGHPADGEPGYADLMACAAMYGGVAVLPQLEPYDPDIVH